jgi:hypothetical protein
MGEEGGTLSAMFDTGPVIAAPRTISGRSGVRPQCYPPEGMDAAVWTAIAVLAATSLGTLFYLGARIDGLAGRMDDRFGQMDARFEALIARMDSRFDRVDARFDHMEDRFDALAARLDAHLDRHAS